MASIAKTLPPTLPHLFIPEDGPPLKEIKPLGKGWSAEVFEVETPKGSRRALKVSLPEREQLVLKEARLLALLARYQIPNLVEYINHFNLIPEAQVEGPERVAILMQLLTPDCIDGFQEMATLEEINRIAKQALETFASLHSKGMIHADIKPDNIRYIEGKLIIFDLGSMHHENQCIPHYPDGTKEYLPPECMVFSRYNTSRDIWSLGVTLFELYTGRDFLPRELLLDDCLYLLRVNMGVCLSSESPSVDASAALAALKKTEATERYNGMPMWEARVYNAAHQRYASDPIAADAEAETVIDLITPMLQYHLARRATAQQLLQKFETQ